MAFQKKGLQDKAYIADYLSDLAKLPESNMGSTCWVIETAEKYMANSKGEWILQTLSTNKKGQSSEGDTDLDEYATIEEVNSKDEQIISYLNAQDNAILAKVDEINEESTVWNQL